MRESLNESRRLQSPNALDGLRQAHIVVVEIAEAEEANDGEELERSAGDLGQLGAVNVIDEDAVQAPVAVQNERGTEQVVGDGILEDHAGRYGGEQNRRDHALVGPEFGVRVMLPRLVRARDGRLYASNLRQGR